MPIKEIMPPPKCSTLHYAVANYAVTLFHEARDMPSVSSNTTTLRYKLRVKARPLA